MDKKQAYENKLENQLKNWNLEYLVMQDLVERIEPDAASQLAGAMSYLKEKRAIAMNKLHKLKSSADNDWEKLRDETDAAWSNLGIALKSISAQLKD